MKEQAKHLDPFTMALNHGETFGVFDRQGDIVNIGKTPQGIFFEGSRHLSLLEFSVNGQKPLLLSSTIREDNDSLTVDLANRPLKYAHKEAPESSVHIKKKQSIENDSYFENVSVKNFNSFEVQLSIVIRFGADFIDVFELRGFYCDQCPAAPQSVRSKDSLAFRYVGRDGILRTSSVRISRQSDGIDVRAEENSLIVEATLASMQREEFAFVVEFGREVPEDKKSLFEGELNRKSLSLENLKEDMPKVESSNSHFNHWVNRSSLDLLALMSSYGDNLYPMAGVPWYNTPFGRDGMITGMQTLLVSPFIAKNTLLFLARHQARERSDSADAEPGKILHELRKGELANIGALPFKKYYGAADSTFLFVWLAQIYFFRTGDKETLDELWPAIENALDWALESADLDGDGFYEYQKRNKKGLDNQCWKDSWDSISHEDGKLASTPLAVCEIQAYAYRAFKAAAKLYDFIDRPEEARFWKAKAKDLKRRFNERFWLEDKQFIALALDNDKRACSVFSSNPGHCLATGILEETKALKVGERLFSKDLFTGWGIRTLGENERRFNPMSYHNGAVWPHDNSLIAYGLKKTGQDQLFMELAEALYDTTMRMELLRLPELFCGFERVENESPTLYPVSCSPQSWASAVVFLLIESMLGVKIKSLEKTVYFERPCLPVWLSWITIKELDVGRGGRFSFNARRARDGEATIEILKRPKGWKVFINK